METLLLKYEVQANSVANENADLKIKGESLKFGTTEEATATLPSPAELYIGAFASCILKNVERFSKLLHFSYDSASISVKANRYDRPARMDDVVYKLTIYSKDEKLKPRLLKKNIEKFGTIYNSVSAASTVDGEIIIVNKYE